MFFDTKPQPTSRTPASASLRVLLALTPTAFLIVILAFVAIAALTRYVSLASMLATVAAVPVAWALGSVQEAQLYIVLAVIIVAKHAGNIRRLLAGEEARFSLGRTSN